MPLTWSNAVSVIQIKRPSMVPKRQSCVTMDPMPALTVIVLVCCAVAVLGWADYSSKALADLCGFICWTGNMSGTFSSSPHGWCTEQGSVNADINIVLTATHYTTSGQHVSTAALNNIVLTAMHYTTSGQHGSPATLNNIVFTATHYTTSGQHGQRLHSITLC